MGLYDVLSWGPDGHPRIGATLPEFIHELRIREAQAINECEALLLACERSRNQWKTPDQYQEALLKQHIGKAADAALRAIQYKQVLHELEPEYHDDRGSD